VADRTGRYRSGLSDDERKALKEDLDAIWAVTRAVLALAGTPLAPVELASRLESIGTARASGPNCRSPSTGFIALRSQFLFHPIFSG
jgi:hypothetical protein